jgi:hypothetical protein
MLTPGSSCAVFTAHNDDETVFMGGTILLNPHVKWYVFSAVSTRWEGTAEAVKRYNDNNVKSMYIQCFHLPDKDKEKEIRENIEPCYSIIMGGITTQFDMVFTHNQRGEYGHEMHIMVNRVVRRVFGDKCPIWEFICPGAGNVDPQPRFKEDWVVPIDKKTLERKNDIFMESYPDQMYLWQNLNDVMVYEFKTGPEIFTRYDSSGTCVK